MNPISNLPPATTMYAPASQALTHELRTATPTSTSSSIKTATLWHELGQKYDLHNMSQQEKEEMSLKLYEGGEFTLFDHAMLSFDDSRIKCLEFGTTSVTNPNQDGNYDLIAEFSARIEDKNRDATNRQTDQRILNILERIDHAKAGPLSIQA